MKNTILLTIFLFIAFCSPAFAQTDCPADKVCLSREAATAALEAGDRAKAAEEKVNLLTDAVNELKKIVENQNRFITEQTSRITALEQNEVWLKLMVESLSKTQRKKCLPFTICVN